MVSMRLLFLSSIVVTLALRRWAPSYMPIVSPFWTCSLLFMIQMFVRTTWCWLIFPRFLSPLRHLPGPMGGSLFMGHYKGAFQGAIGEQLRHWVQDIPNDGLIRYLDIFNMERIAVVNPKALAEVLVTRNYDFEKPAPLRNGASLILGNGILFAEGDDHKAQRKLLAPAFAFRHIKNLYPIFWGKSRELVEALKMQTGLTGGIVQSEAIHVGKWTTKATLDIIGVAGLGRDFNAIKDPDNELIQAYGRIFTPSTASKILTLMNFFLPIWLVRLLPVKRNDDIKGAASVVKRTCYSLIDAKRQSMQKGLDSTSVDILSVAMQSAGFTDEELVNQLMTMLVAGHETTASALSWTVYLMCKHPEMQARLRNEITSHLPQINDSSWSPTFTEIDQLPYLNAVCREVLRLYPPVVLTPRVAAVDTTIQGHAIPKGTALVIPPWAVNTSKELWGEDATNFNPDRWMGPGKANTGGADSNYSFLTFLHGARSCIGQSFAMGEFLCLTAAWFGSFETELAEKDFTAEVMNSITARPKVLDVRLKMVIA